MKKSFLIIAFFAVLFTTQAQDTKFYDEGIEGMEQIHKAIELAQETDRYVMCQVGGNWCPWCIRFAQFATSDSVIAPLMEKEYVYIHVNYSKNNKNIEAMEFLGNPGRFGYPVFVVLNQQGVPIHIQESESLENGKSYDRKRVQKFLTLWSKSAVEAPVKQ